MKKINKKHLEYKNKNKIITIPERPGVKPTKIVNKLAIWPQLTHFSLHLWFLWRNGDCRGIEEFLFPYKIQNYQH